MAAWCRANGVVPVTFYSWRRRLAAETPSASARFVELMPSPATACPPLELRLRRGGRVTLLLRRGFDATLLRDALAFLQAEEPRR